MAKDNDNFGSGSMGGVTKGASPTYKGDRASSSDGPDGREMLNRNRGTDMKGHGREGNMGGMTNGPHYREAGVESTSRQPC